MGHIHKGKACNKAHPLELSAVMGRNDNFVGCHCDPWVAMTTLSVVLELLHILARRKVCSSIPHTST